ncbi:MAG: TetR/AcrR family transcriptional regulator [Desulfobacterota bacterium]|nr:TetR/AcrR family transcriptional regulator [Thermodesulfobacteriota bacterium]
METRDTKSRILKAGARIVLEKGFCDTGLSEVLEAAKVPKGSFYFYFKNKEDFGLQLVDTFAGALKDARDNILGDESLTCLERLREMFRRQTELFRKHGYKGGCPIGNLSQEMGDRSPLFRRKLKQVFSELREDLADQLSLAREKGEMSAALHPEETADFILSSWQGALLQMKVMQSTAAFEVFDRMIFERLLRRLPGKRQNQ